MLKKICEEYCWWSSIFGPKVLRSYQLLVPTEDPHIHLQLPTATDRY